MRAIDLFAGAGGFSEGARAAGVEVVWAANHWPVAVQVHANNHPGVEHVCQDLHQADWGLVPAHDLMLASPACQGHSSASQGGRRAFHDASRSTAWAVVSAAEHHRPEFVIVENVVQFRSWALYPAWRLAMGALGYALDEIVVDAADLGVPQHRRRLFIVCRRGLAPLRLELERRPHTPFAAALDAEATWQDVDRPGRAAGALRRVARGRANHGERFLLQHVTRHPGRSLTRPIGTITTKDQWWEVHGEKMRPLSIDEIRRAMGFPEGYLLPRRSRSVAFKLLGNAVCPPVAQALVEALQAA